MSGAMRRALTACVLACACRGNAQAARTWEPGVPLVERPAPSGHLLALIVTGDGGWAAGDRAIADALASAGIAVVGLDSRAYLRAGQRTPESMTADVTRLLTHYETAWRKDSVILIGYSRGADLLPFVVTRMEERDRARVTLLALVSLSTHAGFQFHWEDLVRDIERPTDLPTAPEVRRLRGPRIVCMPGRQEKTSGCDLLDEGSAVRIPHDGGHALTSETGAAVGKVIVAEAAPPS